MIKKFDVSLKQFGEILISRPDAQNAYSKIKENLKHRQCPLVHLDFESVQVLTPGWLDEFTNLLLSDGYFVEYNKLSENLSVILSIKTVEESKPLHNEK